MKKIKKMMIKVKQTRNEVLMGVRARMRLIRTIRRKKERLEMRCQKEKRRIKKKKILFFELCKVELFWAEWAQFSRP